MPNTEPILCVDDNADNLELMKIFFEIEGYQVVGCNTYQECFDHFHANEFSAIVLDSWLEEASGFEICAAIREFNQAIPIVFYSGDATEKSREKGRQAGANAYLVKPNDIDKLVPTVIELMSA